MRERLFSACQVLETYRPVAAFQRENDNVPEHLPYFGAAIFGENDNNQELQQAVEGLLIIRSLFDEIPFKDDFKKELKNRALPRFRFHYFFRNIEGLWASVCPDDVDEKFQHPDRPIGKLFPQVQMVSENADKSYRVLEVLRCENCNTVFFGGSRGVTKNSSKGNFEMLPVSPKIEGVPEKTPAKLVGQRTYQEYAVFWPQGNQKFVEHDHDSGNIPKDYWRQTSFNEEQFKQVAFEANWVKASINIYSGDVDFEHQKATKLPNDWRKGYVFKVINEFKQDVWNLKDERENSIHTHKALPCACPACGINYQINVRFPSAKPSPIRGFRTGFAKSIQLFAKELMYQLPADEKQQKLVVFSDSREDAASIANGIERNHFTDLLREILINELQQRLLLSSEIYEAINSGKGTIFYEKNHAEAFYDIEQLMEDANLPNSSNPRRQARKLNAEKELKQRLSKIIKVRDLLELNGDYRRLCTINSAIY